ncbi:hypothetical protein ACJX0J_033462 [Zea mays]
MDICEKVISPENTVSYLIFVIHNGIDWFLFYFLVEVFHDHTIMNDESDMNSNPPRPVFYIILFYIIIITTMTFLYITHIGFSDARATNYFVLFLILPSFFILAIENRIATSIFFKK